MAAEEQGVAGFGGAGSARYIPAGMERERSDLIRFRAVSRPAPGAFALRLREVHVWIASLELLPARLKKIHGELSEEERLGAADMRDALARDRWTASRAILRRILAVHTGLPPRSLQFRRGPTGRPVLATNGLSCATGGLAGELHFSLSHSEALAVIGVGRTPLLGVDVELVRPLGAPGPLARCCFSARELAMLERLEPPDRLRALLIRWTRREAVCKASGGWSVGGDRPVDGGWMIRQFEPETGYVATLAVAEPRPRLFGWRLVR